MTLPPGLAAQRFGFGARAGVLPDFAPAARLSQPDRMAELYPGIGGMAALTMSMGARAEVAGARGADQETLRAARRKVLLAARDQTLVNARLELARAVDAEDGYRERLVRFWSDHFTVVARRRYDEPMTAAFADDAIRPHVALPFARMLRAAILHPGMLLYLEQSNSVGPGSAFGKRRARGLNENLARELLELHTLGVEGGYSQQDVRQTALLLTGLTIDAEKGMVFIDRRAEPGAETVLGRLYGTGGDTLEAIHQLLDDLSVDPRTARHLSWKLAVHFVADEPDPALVEDLARVWQQTGGDLLAVSTALAEHPAAQRPKLQKARQPFDFIVASLRALGVKGETIMSWNPGTLRRAALTPMLTMGQPWQKPNGPDGWEEDLPRWITPQGLATRIDWAMHLPRRLARRALPDARDFVDIALPGIADQALRDLVARSETNEEGVGLVLASPQFNRR